MLKKFEKFRLNKSCLITLRGGDDKLEACRDNFHDICDVSGIPPDGAK